MSLRRRALEAAGDIIDGGAYSNIRLKAALGGLDAKSAAWVSAAVYETVEHVSYIDYVLEPFISGRVKPVIRNVLRLGAAQALYMNVPAHAACDESVKLAREIGKGALTGYVNGVMRAFTASMGALRPLPEGSAARLSTEFGWPRFMTEEYIETYGAEFTRAMYEYKGGRRMTVRPQPPYTARELAQALDERGIAYERGRLSQEAFHLAAGLDIAGEPLFTDGRITVQSESSMLVCDTLGAESGMTVLDACAAPGGKTALLAGRGALVTAMELHPHRAELIRSTLARLHVENVRVEVGDAAEYRAEFESAFDRVLVDAPCSGFGVTGKPDVRRNRAEGDIAALAGTQARILATASRYVKPGGVMVYSSCTVSRRENGETVRGFLSAHPEFELESERQLFPHVDGSDGFYIARMRRDG